MSWVKREILGFCNTPRHHPPSVVERCLVLFCSFPFSADPHRALSFLIDCFFPSLCDFPLIRLFLLCTLPLRAVSISVYTVDIQLLLLKTWDVIFDNLSHSLGLLKIKESLRDPYNRPPHATGIDWAFIFSEKKYVSGLFRIHEVQVT